MKRSFCIQIHDQGAVKIDLCKINISMDTDDAFFICLSKYKYMLSMQEFSNNSDELEHKNDKRSQ